MDVKIAQQRLKDFGLYDNTVDGVIGIHTIAALLAYISKRWIGKFNELPHAIQYNFNEYEINTPARICHFLAQAAIETEGFMTFVELGDENYFLKYDFRLGNDKLGDGYRYRGRGIFQITGKANYLAMSRKIGASLITNPETLEEPFLAARSACQFWKDHGLANYADADDCKGLTKKLNGGYNGLTEREDMVEKLKELFLK